MAESKDAARNSVDAATGRWVLLATILASSMAFIDGSALNVALPALQRDLGANGAELLWIINAYMLMLASLILVGGSLGDIYGRKRVLGIGIALFAVASAVCGLAGDVTLLIAARVVQGLGGALMVPGSLAIITALFPADRRGRAIGTWGAFATLTPMLGPWLGGELAAAGLWRAVFFINVPLAVVALTALILHVPESHDDSAVRQVDVPGALLATLGLAGVTFGFVEAPGRGFNDPLILLTLGGGIAALVAFIVVELRGAQPMLPLGLFRSRTFSGTNLLTFFLYAGLNGALFFLPLNLIQAQGYGDQIAGRAVLPFSIALTLMSRWAGGLVDRIGPRPPLIIGPAVTGLGFFLLTLPDLTGGPDAYWTTFFPGVLMVGIGMGVTVAPLTTAVMGSVAQTRAGIASGVNNAVSRTAGALAVAILGAVALTSFSGALTARTTDLNLSSEARAQLQVEAASLGDASVPDAVAEAQRPAVAEAIKAAFVDAFRLVTGISAGLALLAAVLAALLVEPRLTPHDTESSA